MVRLGLGDHRLKEASIERIRPLIGIPPSTKYDHKSQDYTASCCGLSGIHEAVIQLEAEASN